MEYNGKEHKTINELVKEVPFSKETITRDLNAGRFSAEKVGKVWQIPYDEAKKYYDEKSKQKKKELKEKESDESYKKIAEKYSAKAKEFDAKIRELNYLKKCGKYLERSEVEEALRRNIESIQARFQNFGVKMDGCNFKELQDEIDEILLEYHKSQEKALKDIEQENE